MPKQAVKVIIRTRPTANFASKNLVIDQAKGQMQIMLDKDEAHGSVNNMTDLYKFNFEKILHNASQDETYEASASEIIQSVVDGYNGTVLCYGQTGAGKTYTMTGSATQFKYRGIIPRALNQIYALTSARFDQAVTVRISYAEIYNERIRDLIPEKDGYSKADLSQQDQNLQITDDGRNGVCIKGLAQHVCEDEDDALHCLFEGELNRTIAQHSMNENSSRAHTILTVYLESRSRVESADKVTYSKLHLVDLAGSERTKKTGTSGHMRIEASYINKSLSFLEQVVLALCDRQRDHIPYRQAKLTNFLRDSLGGNCKTVMVANVWPERNHLEECNSTLKFATRMMKVSNEASVNIAQDPGLLVKRYEKEIRDLKQELAMHGTLKGGKRINYGAYGEAEQQQTQECAQSFLDGSQDNIGEINSLRRVREVMSYIRTQYRHTSQKVEAMRRQIEKNPTAFKSTKKEPTEETKTVEESEVPGTAEEQPVEDQADLNEEGSAKGSTSAPQTKQKREFLDKQSAFAEFKMCEEGQIFEQRILEARETAKQRKTVIKDITGQLNNSKIHIDQTKAALDRKEDERKMRHREEQNQMQQTDAFKDEPEEIIDEEELHMLRKMKGHKNDYKEKFNLLKNAKAEFNDAQMEGDMMKERLVSSFENWYIAEFDVPVQGGGLMIEDEANLSSQEWLGGAEANVDAEQDTFMRAKKKVEILTRARKMDKRR